MKHFFKKSIIEESKIEIKEELIEEEAIKEPNYIWVDGFKSMSWQMTGWGDYQFEVGKTYTIDNDKPIRKCENGFHFYSSIDHLTNKENPYKNNGRIFKVRGLVREDWLEVAKAECEKEYERYNRLYLTSGFGFPPEIDWKLVTNTIEIVEEISYDEYVKIYNPIIFVKTQEEYEKFIEFMNQKHEGVEYPIRLWIRNKFYEKMKSLNMFSDSFIDFLWAQGYYSAPKYERIYNLVKPLIETGVSIDFIVYFILEELKK